MHCHHQPPGGAYVPAGAFGFAKTQNLRAAGDLDSLHRAPLHYKAIINESLHAPDFVPGGRCS
jgi:hypothetical protein